MDHSGGWQEVLTEGCVIRQVEDNIYSALPNVQHNHLYDKRAAAYDAVVGTWLYNRVMWGTSPADYVTFAREALDSHPQGRMLDAACGSLLFTAQSYLSTNRQIIAFDQSLQMLKRARTRLIDLAGSFPGHIVLLQADLTNIVFQPASFDTVLCMNVLHQFAAAAELIPKLRGLLVDGGRLYLTSLVSNGRYVGDRWLAALYKTGEFVRPRTSAELSNLLDELLVGATYRTKGNMAFASFGAKVEISGA
ncbi:MAG: class I SAM-dependent methyltransferase [Acidobacteriota bacterium]